MDFDPLLRLLRVEVSVGVNNSTCKPGSREPPHRWILDESRAATCQTFTIIFNRLFLLYCPKNDRCITEQDSDVLPVANRAMLFDSTNAANKMEHLFYYMKNAQFIFSAFYQSYIRRQNAHLFLPEDFSGIALTSFTQTPSRP